MNRLFITSLLVSLMVLSFTGCNVSTGMSETYAIHGDIPLEKRVEITNETITSIFKDEDQVAQILYDEFPGLGESDISKVKIVAGKFTGTQDGKKSRNAILRISIRLKVGNEMVEPKELTGHLRSLLDAELSKKGLRLKEFKSMINIMP